MEPFEETITDMLAVAKILGRLSIEGHITPDELATMQAQLMKPLATPFVIGTVSYTPPVVTIPKPSWGGSVTSSGTFITNHLVSTNHSVLK